MTRFGRHFCYVLIAGALLFATPVRAQGIVSLLSTVDFPGKRVTDVTSYVDIFSQIEYAIVGHSGGGISGIAIVDLSDPEFPQVISTLDGPPGFDVKVFDTFVYTVTGGGDGGTNQGAIIDISNPFAPVRVAGFPSSHNIFIDAKGFMYAEAPGLIIYDLNINPLAPVEVWRDGLGGGHDATVVGDTLYDFHGSSGTTIYDVTDRSNPVELGMITPPFVNYHHSGWTTTDGSYLFIDDELSQHPSPDVTIWDISDPADPEFVGEISDSLATVHNLHIVGDLAFFSYYSAGFKVYNIAEPTTPVLVGSFDTDPINTPGFTGAFGVDAFLPSGMILVSGQSGTDPGKLHILNVEGFTTVGVDDAPFDRGPELSLEIFPNPARTETTISFEGHGETTLSVFDMVGREIYSEALNSRKGIFSTNWNVASLPSGVYYIHVESGQLQESKTISIVR